MFSKARADLDKLWLGLGFVKAAGLVLAGLAYGFVDFAFAFGSGDFLE